MRQELTKIRLWELSKVSCNVIEIFSWLDEIMHIKQFLFTGQVQML